MNNRLKMDKKQYQQHLLLPLCLALLFYQAYITKLFVVQLRYMCLFPKGFFYLTMAETQLIIHYFRISRLLSVLALTKNLWMLFISLLASCCSIQSIISNCSAENQNFGFISVLFPMIAIAMFLSQLRIFDYFIHSRKSENEFSFYTENTNNAAVAPLKQVLAIVLYFYWPAVSQKFIRIRQLSSSTTSNLRISVPTVELLWRFPSSNPHSFELIQVLPTPWLPTTTTLASKLDLYLDIQYDIK